MDVLRRDVRSALVAMRRAPGFAATALITLALGIGATTAVFSIVQGVLLRPLPYAEPGSAGAALGGTSGRRVAGRQPMVEPFDLRGVARADAHARRAGRVRALPRSRHPRQRARQDVRRAGVAGGARHARRDARARPSSGRRGRSRRRAAVVVLSDGLWRERYGANPGVLGASLAIDGDAHTIVGVARPAFAFPEPRVRFWMPYVIPRSAAQPTGAIVFTALGRLKPGVTLAQAEAEGTAAARAAPKHRLTELFFGKGGAPRRARARARR